MRLCFIYAKVSLITLLISPIIPSFSQTPLKKPVTQIQLAPVTTLRGKLIDKRDKSPIVGASVIELDKEGRTISGTQTDFNGAFALKIISRENKISFSFIGYKSQVQEIGEKSSFFIVMEQNGKNLREVTVTSQRTVSDGSGLNVDARKQTGAVATIDAKKLEELGATSVDQALQGRLAGVDLGTTTGDPGAPLSIRIRGTASINGSSNPLIVLDGLPYEIDIPSDFNFGTADEQGYAQLLNIAPSDILDITVLKDAASTAIWGSRAAKGVLVINTKRGVKGTPVVTYTFRGALYKQPPSIPLLNGDQFSTLIPEAVINAQGIPLDLTVNKEFAQDPNDPVTFNNYNKNTDWIKAITQIGHSQEHNVSINGGGEKAAYYASIGYTNQVGTSVGADLVRITSKINLDYNVSKRIKFRSDFTYTNIKNDLDYVPASSSQLRNIAYTKLPNQSIYQFDEYGNQTPLLFTPPQNIQGQYPKTYNPLALALYGVSKQTGQRITPHFNLRYSIIPEILLSTFDIQFDVNNTQTKTFLPQEVSGRPSIEIGSSRATSSDGDQFLIASKTNLIFTPKLGDLHSFSALASVQTNDNKTNGLNVSSYNTATSLLQDVVDPSRTQVAAVGISSPVSQNRSVGFLFNAKYDFRDRYLFNLAVRVDGNSRFGANHRYGAFPSFSFAYRISDEPFLKKLTFIEDVRLRGSYGISGNAPSKDYLFYNQYLPYNYTYQGQSGVLSSNPEVSNLKYETLIGRNLGINIVVFKGRLRFDGDIYLNVTKDLFNASNPLPSYTGYGNIAVNIGTLENKGWEIGFNSIILKNKTFSVGFDFNIAQNLNRLLSLAPNTALVSNGNGIINTNGQYLAFLRVGQPFGSFYGFKSKGVYKDADATIARDAAGNKIIGPDGVPIQTRFNYPQNGYIFRAGDAQYEDINHDGNIDAKDVVYLGNGIPKVTGGFGPNFLIGSNWKFLAFFNYRLGYSLINNTKAITTNQYGFDNQSTAVLRRWRNPGDITDIPRALHNTGYNWLGSDRYVEPASFVRLRQVTVRYNVRDKLLKALGLRSASAYVTVENLYTWTKYSGQDPDVSLRGESNPFSFPVDNSLTPPSKSILFGLTAGF